MMWIIAILTMLVGAAIAIVQTDVKRMLAYSSIAHTGFLLTRSPRRAERHRSTSGGDLAAGGAVLPDDVRLRDDRRASPSLTLVRDSGGEANTIDRWTGLGRRSPLVAGIFAFFLLSLAGIPLTAGFVGKWAVFVALSAGAWPVVLTAIVSSIIAVYFYVRYIRLMFFVEPQGEVASVTSPSVLTSLTILVGVVGTVVLGIVPGPVLDLAAHAGQFIR